MVSFMLRLTPVKYGINLAIDLKVSEVLAADSLAPMFPILLNKLLEIADFVSRMSRVVINYVRLL